MNIKDEFTCKHCNETFKDPVSLICCGENVCKKHIDEKLLQKESNDIVEPLVEKKVRKRRSKKSMNSLNGGGGDGGGDGGDGGDGDTKNLESPVIVKIRKRRVCKSKNNTNKDKKGIQ